MGSLLLLNGSPRGPRSNSMKMLARVAEGWERSGGAAPRVLHLARREDFLQALADFPQAGTVLLGMPLYTDAMPALVLAWVEALAQRLAQLPDPALPTWAFLVQSGFPEALHSRPLERYLEKLARRLGAAYAGTIVRGGGESLQARPEHTLGRLWAQLQLLGGQLARDGRFGAEALRDVAGTERFRPATAALVALACRLPLFQFYWNRQLKRNGAWERRFAAPHGPAWKP